MKIMFPDLKTPLSHALVVYPLDASFPFFIFTPLRNEHYSHISPTQALHNRNNYAMTFFFYL